VHSKATKATKIILGIDPGTNVLGYGVLEIAEKDMHFRCLGVFHLKKEKDHYRKLNRIYELMRQLIQEHHPHEMAIESPFFGKNVQSMLKLGRAQGVAITVALAESIPVFEYSPRKIKQSVTGNGNASKQQVSGVLKQLFIIDEETKFFDATDALAAAVCHHFQSNSVTNSSKKFNGWNDFLAKNPQKII
jgi:crossover junction endodeoxyribonuclease RuvC